MTDPDRPRTQSEPAPTRAGSRPWVPLLVGFGVVVLATVVAGVTLRERLADAGAALGPAASLGAPDPDVTAEDLGICAGREELVSTIRDFHERVAEDLQADSIERSPDSFDSFGLDGVVTRLVAEPHQLRLQVRAEDGGWCLAEAEISVVR